MFRCYCNTITVVMQSSTLWFMTYILVTQLMEPCIQAKLDTGIIPQSVLRVLVAENKASTLET